MNRIFLAAMTALSVMALGAAPSWAQKAYIANSGSNSVSVLSTVSDEVVGNPITVGSVPSGVAVTPDGSKVYVTNTNSNTVSVISTASNTVAATVNVRSQPFGVAVTPDGNKVYVANKGSSTVSVIATATDTVTATITVGNAPTGVAATPDGSKVYVTNISSNTVSVISTATDTVIATVNVGIQPFGVAVTPDGSKVYVANNFAGTVSVISTASNTVTGGPITVGSKPAGVAVTPDGSKVYVTNTNSNTVSVIATTSNTVTGTINVGGSPTGVSATPDGSKVYVANSTGNTVSVIATASNTVAATTLVGASPISFGAFIGPAITDNNVNLVAAVLPLSRSVTIGTPATAFATIINAGTDDASVCSIAPATGIPALFTYETTDPTTNNVTGTLDTPVTIPAGKPQTFVIAFTPQAVFSPTNVAFAFTCANAPNPAPVLLGINTLNLSGSTTQVPDIIALNTSADPGYVDLNQSGVGVFAVATANLGSGGQITVAANTGTATLPVTLLVCQTNPTTGACMGSGASPSVTTTILPGAQPTFGIFIDSAGATVADMPGVNRAFVTFTDSNGVLRGETSVAIRTH